MKSYLPTATLIYLVLLVTGCQPAAEQPDPAAEAARQAEDVAALKSLVSQWDATLNAGDASAVPAFFTDDSIRMPPNEPTLIGKEAIRSRYQALLDQFNVKVSNQVLEVEVADDWAFIRGTYSGTLTPKTGGDPAEQSGRGLQICRRQADGSWKVYLGMWNSDQPLPGAGE